MRAVMIGTVAVLHLALAGQAYAQSRHFAASQQHFKEIADRAWAVNQHLENPGEKSIINYFFACSLIYAAKAHAMAQMADVLARQQCPEDRAFTAAKLAETRAYAGGTVAEDLRMLDGTLPAIRHSGMKSLGVRLQNEIRVFAHNLEAQGP